MQVLVTYLLDLLPLYGPWLLLVLAFLETVFITGLVVPSGVATSVATVLALEGRMDLLEVVLAATVGGALGDSVGFFIGRTWGVRVLSGQGRFATAARKKHQGLNAFFGRHPGYSVTLARLISFVRTLMPMAAGMSGLSYRRYLPYELVGLVGWAAIYVATGAVARESWEMATQLVGAASVTLFLVVGLTLWVVLRRRGNSADGEARGEAL